MFKVSDLEGTLMRVDDEQICFKIEKSEVVDMAVVCDRKKLPYEFRLCKSDKRALLMFLEDRTVPETRIGITEALKKAGIPYYDPAMILKLNHACSVSDGWWIRYKGETMDYSEMHEKMMNNWGIKY